MSLSGCMFVSESLSAICQSFAAAQQLLSLELSVVEKQKLDRYSINESEYKILVLVAFPSNEGSGEHAQMCRLVRALAAHIHKMSRDM